MLLSAAAPDLRRGRSSSRLLLCSRSLPLSVATSDFGGGVAPLSHSSAQSMAAGALLHGLSQKWLSGKLNFIHFGGFP